MEAIDMKRSPTLGDVARAIEQIRMAPRVWPTKEAEEAEVES